MFSLEMPRRNGEHSKGDGIIDASKGLLYVAFAESLQVITGKKSGHRAERRAQWPGHDGGQEQTPSGCTTM